MKSESVNGLFIGDESVNGLSIGVESGSLIDPSGPLPTTGLSVRLGPSDMMDIHDGDSLDGLDFLNNEADDETT
ncbi:hypothetical protein CASFOL_001331 [Castilleja foliolosa]|uniref:Uncharacterized protein n=1 Tax=Castilleja foliolosa TaxID=1961234 RepID=A0ABD3EM96_9LAMI